MNHLKILLLSSIALLPGCALYDAYMMAGYDNEEYGLVTQLRTQAEMAKEVCDDPVAADAAVEQMLVTATQLRNFTQFIPDNEDAMSLSENLHKLVSTTQEQFEGKDQSAGYCKAKVGLIAKNAKSVQEVLGSKPR